MCPDAYSNDLPNDLEQAQAEIIRLRKIAAALKGRMKHLGKQHHDHSAIFERNALLQQALAVRNRDVDNYLVERRRLASLLEHSQRMAIVGGWEVDAATQELYWTSVTHQIFGVDEDTRPTLSTAIALFPPSCQQRVADAVEQALKQGTPFDLELPLISAAGDHKRVRLVGEGEWAEGRVRRVYGSMQDISQQREAVSALRNSEERFRQMAAQISDGLLVFCYDPVRIEYASPSMSRLTGFSQGTILNWQMEDVFELVHPDDRAVILEIVSSAMRAGEHNARYTFRVRNANGAYAWREDHATYTYDKAGNVTQTYVVCRDITAQVQAREEQERLREQAEAASRAKGDFLANMSHELRTPMAGILGMTELLLETKLDAEQRDFAETAYASGRSLLTIINDVLDFSKIEAGRMTLHQEPIDLMRLLREVCDLLRASAEKKGLALLVCYPSRLPRNIVSDGNRLRQILINLVGNAVKFTEQGFVQIEVAAQQTGSAQGGDESTPYQFEITVCDSGPGISAADQQELFNAFTQVAHVMTKPHAGTGLGLAISQRLAELMGGRIDLRSELGQGTCFALSIPLLAQGEIPSRPPLINCSVLLVSPLRQERELVAAYLQAWSVKVLQADGPQQTLALLEGLPDMGGTLTHIIESDLLCSGHADPAHQRYRHYLAALPGERWLLCASTNRYRDTPCMAIDAGHRLPRPLDPDRLYQTLCGAHDMGPVKG